MAKQTNSILGTKSCFGCGVCALACAKHLIEIKLNKDGFYEPVIAEPDRCTNCGLCSKVCSFSNEGLVSPNPVTAAYSAWSNNPKVRLKCSSGGVAFELGKKMLEEGGQVCSSKYNVAEARAEHYVASTEEELYPSIGSKYIQSYTVDGFKAINLKGKNLVVGTPCQIDSLRRLLKLKKVEDNFILVDFFCHGTPSMLAWKKYLKEAEKKTGEVTYVSWRNKIDGWHDSWAVNIDGVNNSQTVGWKDSYNLEIREKKTLLNSRWSRGDSFYGLFLGNYCLGKACYDNCKFKKYASSADIRVGDMWGSKFEDCKEGVSAVLTFTQKGDDFVRSLDGCTINEEKPEVAAEGQILKPVDRPWFRGMVMCLLKCKAFTTKQILFVAKVFNKFTRIIRK